MAALVIMRDLRVRIDLVGDVIEALGRNRHRAKAHVAAERFRVPQRPEAAQFAFVEQPSYAVDQSLFVDAERGPSGAERPRVEREAALQPVDDGAIERVEIIHQFGLSLAARSSVEKTAPRCLKHRVENSTA